VAAKNYTVSLAAARTLMQQIGIKSAGTQDKDALTKKFGKIKEFVDKDIVAGITDANSKKLLKEVLAAQKEGRTIEVVGDGTPAGLTKGDGEDAPKKADKAAKAGKAEGGEKGEKAAGFKNATGKAGGTGVIATIIECIKAASPKQPVTKEEIGDELERKFPERGRAKMMKTVHIQVPNRLRKEKELDIVNNGSGGYYLSREGKSK
jgi:hypothetical protein